MDDIKIVYEGIVYEWFEENQRGSLATYDGERVPVLMMDVSPT